MEALALLCTLHADGPATLKRLRRAGCDSLYALESYDADGLAELLGLTPAAARRLGREARALDSRLGGGLLEREEAPDVVRAPLAQATEAPTRESFSAAESKSAPGSYRGDTGSLDARDRDLLGRVLAKWENADSGSGSTPFTPDTLPTEVDEESADEAHRAAPMTASSSVVAHVEAEVEARAAAGLGSRAVVTSAATPVNPVIQSVATAAPERAPVVPAPVVPALDERSADAGPSAEPSAESFADADVGIRLTPGLLAGLGAGHVAVLAEEGIVGLSELSEAAPLDLARALGESFAQVRRWQFLARRIDAAATEGEARPASPPAVASARSAAAAAAAAPGVDVAPRSTETSSRPGLPHLSVRKPWPVQAVRQAAPPAAEPAPEIARPEVATQAAPIEAVQVEPGAAPAPEAAVIPPAVEPQPVEEPAEEPVAAERTPAPVRATETDEPAPVPPRSMPLATVEEPTREVSPGWTPRKFWEAPRTAASSAADATTEAVETGKGRTTLNWNFEIPPPPPLPPRSTAPTEKEQPGGPFA